jgi:hypothetical protein
MVKLAAFADEIGPNLDDQIGECKGNGVTHFELRGVYGRNVMDFDAGLRDEIRQLVVARNERRMRRGEEPLDVEAEVQRQVEEFGA